MTVREDISELVASLAAHAQTAREQGREPREVPMNLQTALDLVSLLGRLADTLMEAHSDHVHDVVVNNKKRPTSGPI